MQQHFITRKQNTRINGVTDTTAIHHETVVYFCQQQNTMELLYFTDTTRVWIFRLTFYCLLLQKVCKGNVKDLHFDFLLGVIKQFRANVTFLDC